MVIDLSATVDRRIFWRHTVSVGEHHDFILDIIFWCAGALFLNHMMYWLLVLAAVQIITTIHQAVLVIIETIAILIFSVGLW